jgi:hypothetical protein
MTLSTSTRSGVVEPGLVLVQPAQMDHGPDRVRMLLAQLGLPQLEGPCEMGLGLIQVPELLVRLPERHADRCLHDGLALEPTLDVGRRGVQHFPHRDITTLALRRDGRQQVLVQKRVDGFGDRGLPLGVDAGLVGDGKMVLGQILGAQRAQKQQRGDDGAGRQDHEHRRHAANKRPMTLGELAEVIAHAGRTRDDGLVVEVPVNVVGQAVGALVPPRPVLGQRRVDDRLQIAA